MGAAQKSTHLRVRRLPPADLGDGRDDPARQQAAAHRLVLGRLPDGDPLQRHLCPAAPETARYRLLPQRLAARPQAARQHGRPRAQPVVGPGGNRRGQAFRTKDDPPTGGQGRSHDGKMLIVGAIELGDGNIPGRLRLAEISSYAAADLGHFVETAADPDAIAKPTAGPATLRSPPIATMSMSSGRPPLTSSCRGSTKSSPTSKDGREASTTGCVASICRPISMSSSFASTAAKPATLLSARSSASPPMQNPLPTAC